MTRSHVVKVRDVGGGSMAVLSPERPEVVAASSEGKKRRPYKRVDLDFTKTTPVKQDLREEDDVPRPSTAQCRVRRSIESAQIYEEHLQHATPTLPPETVDLLRKDVHSIAVDESNNTVSLTKAEIEAIKDPDTLEFLAARPGLSRYVTGAAEQWMPCSVFITAIDDEGRPTEASIDDDVITYSVGGSCPPTPSTVPTLTTPASTPTPLPLPTPSYTAAPVPAPAPARSTRRSFMKGTASSNRRKRNLLQEHEDRVQPEEEVIEEIIETEKEKPKRVILKDVPLHLSQRRVLSEEEEQQVEGILSDPRYDSEDVAPREGEGYSANQKDKAAESEIHTKLRDLRPDLAIDELLKAEEVLPGAVYEQEKASERDRLIEKARGESLALRGTRDYLTEQKIQRETRQRLTSVNDQLTALYETKAEEEEQIKFQLEYGSNEGSSKLASGVLRGLLEEAAKEQGVCLESYEDEPLNATTETRRPRCFIDPHGVDTVEGIIHHPEHSTYGVLMEDEPADPSMLFPNATEGPPVHTDSLADPEDAEVADMESARGSSVAGDDEAAVAPVVSPLAAPPAAPVPESPETIPLPDTSPVQRPMTADCRRNLFLTGDWGQLLERGNDGHLERPCSRLSQRAQTSRPGPTPEPDRDPCPTPPTHKIDRLVL